MHRKFTKEPSATFFPRYLSAFPVYFPQCSLTVLSVAARHGVPGVRGALRRAGQTAQVSPLRPQLVPGLPAGNLRPPVPAVPPGLYTETSLGGRSNMTSHFKRSFFNLSPLKVTNGHRAVAPPREGGGGNAPLKFWPGGGARKSEKSRIFDHLI